MNLETTPAGTTAPKRRRNPTPSLAGLGMAIILAWPTSMLAASHMRTPEGDQVDVISGNCDAHSVTTEGPMGSDLSKRERRYYCDSAVITYFKRNPGHMLIQFAESKSSTDLPMGFGGHLNKAGTFMAVQSVYFTPTERLFADDGGCKFFFEARKMTALVCLGVVDRDGRRSIANMSFKVAPGQ